MTKHKDTAVLTMLKRSLSRFAKRTGLPVGRYVISFSVTVDESITHMAITKTQSQLRGEV